MVFGDWPGHATRDGWVVVVASDKAHLDEVIRDSWPFDIWIRGAAQRDSQRSSVLFLIWLRCEQTELLEAE